ncbi:precorrin-3B C(17)-methyltransferase [Paradevosia shaoguanensis]|uniref:precorrin-3B C(17)-methyltransferase n=1 Tax=Paradevosia shaoguanensis TaxID=1335043 RepID=UPI003643DFB8
MAQLTPAIFVLNAASLETAQRIQSALPGARIFGLETRVIGADVTIANFGDALRDAYREDRPIIALCAAGILIRALAPLLQSKLAEPPVLAIAEDGSAVVPLLGATRGVNALARTIGEALATRPAITTTGELRFGINLLNPPPGYQLLNAAAAKSFVSELLSGRPVQIDGDAPWLEFSGLTVDPSARLRIRIVDAPAEAGPDELVYLYRPVAGRLAVIGLGPGDAATRTPEVTAELRAATDILGYQTYVDMAGPFRPDQRLHPSDNRQELQRARAALDLAASGRRVVLVSSGDPGIFAMAAAVMEALAAEDNPAWRQLDLSILPGISAAMATAARAGAPLGHDFAVLSLSDNLKSWDIIEQRLAAAAGADFVLALYNPISKARPHQLDRALEILRRFREPGTPVIVGRDIGRPAETLSILTLGELTSAAVDSRSTLIIGSSRTRRLHATGHDWVFTPRSYD